MDSQADPDIDLDLDLEQWLTKRAAEEGVSRDELRQNELAIWERWRENPNANDFEQLMSSHAPLISKATSRYVSTSNLPPAAVRGAVMRQYVEAVEEFDPTKGAMLSSYVTTKLGQRIPRYINRYTNTGRIPDDKGWLIRPLQQVEVELAERLGQEPSNAQLADELLISMQDIAHNKKKAITPRAIATLRKSLRRDYLAETAGHEWSSPGRSVVEQQAVFLHGSLNPEQQLVLEHTFSGFGKRIISDVDELARELNMSPQKVRGIKKQLEKKLAYYYQQAGTGGK